MGRAWSVAFCSIVLLVTAGCAAPRNGSQLELTGPTGTTSATTAATPTSDKGLSLDQGPSVAPGTASVEETSTAASLPDCNPNALATHTPGILTIATGQTLSAPWFTGQDPATSDGYEASIARDVATGLGYGSGRVSWVQVDTQQAVAGSTARFDILIDQVREPQSGSDLLDFSTGYYAITDALLMPKQAVDALAGKVPDLTTLRVGAIAGSTGESAAHQRGVTPVIFASSVDGVTALNGGSVDALLLPTPDALSASRSLTSLAVVGQLSPGQWQPDQFHLVLAKDSPLTPCVTAAVDRLRIEGTVDALTQQWITGPLAPQLG